MKIEKTRLHKKIQEYLKSKNIFDYTHSEVQRNIEHFGVILDDKLIYNRLQWVFPEQNIQLNSWPQRNHGEFEKIKILLNKPEFIVIYKPAGVVVEPGAGHQKANLLNWLEENNKQKFFLIHRIDKDTQGILIVAKSEPGQKFFQDQFRLRSVVKKYLAIVEGNVDKVFTVENWQSRDKNNPMKQKLFWIEGEAMNYEQNSRYAKSIIKPKFYCSDLNQSLIEIEIKTGRMHQIRLQCEALGFPLLNDKVYNIKNKKLPQSIVEKSSFSIRPTLEMLESEFVDLKNKLFDNQDYCLLSNYLKLQDMNNTYLEIELQSI